MRRLTLIAVATVTLAVLLLPQATLAQSVTLDLGQGGTLTGRVIQLIALMTVLTLAPSILVVMTSFIRISIVLSILRSAMGTQTTPPNTVLVSLALFLTFRSEEHTSELQSLMRISYAVFCLKKKTQSTYTN